ncbi:MAG: DUF2971 domain-containing protein [Saprospiraceae bacterium]
MSERFEQMARLEEDYMKNVVPTIISNPSGNILNYSGLSVNGECYSVELSNLFSNGTQYDPKSTEFIHFTSLRSLQSIIKENAIRLYSLTNANDPKEFEFYNESILLENKSPDWLKSNTFILSLCDSKALTSNNALNLWRLYGDGGLGVAIEFEIDVPQNGVCNYFLGKINYQRPDIESFLIKSAQFEKRHNIKVDYSEIIRVLACFHKSDYYEIEKEVRLMFFDDNHSRARENLKEYNFMNEFNSRNNLVTYNWLQLAQEQHHKLPQISIKRIELGFRHPEEVYQNFHLHMVDTFAAKSRAGLWKGQLPIIEHSPLKNIYR